MSILVDLRHDSGRPWSHFDRTHVKGHAFDSAGRLLRGRDLAEKVGDRPADLPARIASLNGEFAAVIEDGRSVAAGVDPIRSTPLFYADHEGTLLVGDDAHALAGLTRSGPSEDALLACFLLQGFVPGAHTLAREVRQIQAGECIVGDGEWKRVPTHTFGQDQDPRRAFDRASDRETSLEEGVALVDALMDRCLKSIGDRPIAVPLSGGLDSRFVAAAVARRGRTDTLCYTYGRRGSFDTTTSREIARRLGLRWVFIPYDNRKWHQWGKHPSYARFRRNASQLTSIEHEQDWPAIRVLLEQSEIDEQTVVVPGHSGDFLAGSHLPGVAFDPDSDSSVAHWIWKKYLRLWPIESTTQRVQQSVTDVLENLLAETGKDLPHTVPGLVRQFDRYGLRERQAKLIVNSVRVYEHHGLDWRIPLWDREWIDYWAGVPVVARHRREHAIEILRRSLGSLMDIPFEPRRVPSTLERIGRVIDVNYRRYGLYLGPRPMLRGLRGRLGDLVNGHNDLINSFVLPLQNQWPQRLPLNALTALKQLDDSLVTLDN